MRSQRLLCLARVSFALTVCFVAQGAMAQFTGEFVICTDGSSIDNCRASALPADELGIVTWGRDLGSTLCAGVGFVPQDTDCTFGGNSFNGFGCVRTQDFFGARAPAGADLAIACGDIEPLPNGEYSAQALRSSCFVDQSICQPFVLTDITP